MLIYKNMTRGVLSSALPRWSSVEVHVGSPELSEWIHCVDVRVSVITFPKCVTQAWTFQRAKTYKS